MPTALLAIDQGGACTSNSQCASGLACIDADINMVSSPARWSGITISSMVGMLSRSQAHFVSAFTEDDLWEYTKYLNSKVIMKSGRSSSYSISNNSTSGFPRYYKHGYKTVDKERVAIWNAITKAQFLSRSGSKYLIETLNSSKSMIIRHQYETKSGKLGIEAKHILGFYSKKKAYNVDGIEVGTYLSYLETMKASCTGATTDDDDNIACDTVYEIMDEITGHLSDYRSHLRELFPSKKTALILEYRTGGIIRNLDSYERPAQGPEYCYSFRLTDQGNCVPPVKVCSCAFEGEKIVNNTQQCCSNNDAVSSFGIPLIPNSNNICTSFYIPTIAYGPGDGTTPDYTIALNNSGTGFGKCEFVTTFNNTARFEELEMSHSNQEEKISSLISYINNDWMIALSLEYLFSEPATDNCLRPNFKGRSGKSSPSRSDPTFSDLMRDKIAFPLQTARINGNEAFQKLKLFQNETKEKTEFNCYNINESSMKSEGQCESVDALTLGLDAAIEKEKKMLSFENSLLYGVASELPLNEEIANSSPIGIAPILNCCGDTEVKDIDKNVLTGPDKEITWFEALKHGYRNIKYKRKYSRKVLSFGSGKRRNHRFEGCRGRKRVGRFAYNQRIRIKKKGTDYFLIDPPLPKIVGSDVGDRRSKYSRKLKKEELKNELTAPLARYFTEFSFTGDDSGQSFLTFKNPQLALNILGEYTYYLFDSYSHRNKKDGGYYTRRRHLVKSRIDTFYPQAETAVEELGYYLNQLAKARVERLTCLNNIKNSMNIGGGGSHSTNIQSTAVTTNQDLLGVGNNAVGEDGKSTINPNDSSSASSGISAGSSSANLAGITSVSNQAGTGSQSSTTTGATVSAYDSFNNAAAKRAKNKLELRNKALKKVNSKYHDLIRTASKAGIGRSNISRVAAAFSGSSSNFDMKGLDNNQNRAKSRKSDNEKEVEKADGKKTLYQQAENNPLFEFNDSDDYSSSAPGEDGSYSAENSPETAQMLTAIDKNKKKYSKSESDSLFQQVSKAYFRSGYKRLLNKRKKNQQ